MSIVTPPAPRHRLETGNTNRRWRLVVLALVAVLLPLSPVIATKAMGAAPAAKPGKVEGKKPGKDEEPVWQGVPGTNLAHDVYGYPWPAAPDCDESNVATSGCVNDGLGFFQGQCTSWVAHRVSQRNGISFSNWFGGTRWGNASDWARVAKGLGHERNKVPAVGAIGWYRRGHVSYVEDVYTDGGVVISEMNTDGHNGFHLTTVYPGGAGYPDRFIHVADVVPVDYTAPEPPSPVTARHVERGVEVQWRQPIDDIGVTGYRVLRNGTPLAETQTPGYVDRSASPGQTYTYSVVASDAAGNVSEPARGSLAQMVPASARLRGPLLAATEVTTSAGTAVCGRSGTSRRQHLACRVRADRGWQTLRTGRQVPWGLAGTRAFVASDDGTRVWFCREVRSGRNGCVPLDLETGSWGFDRRDQQRKVPDHAVWKATAAGPARCGLVADRPSCTVLRKSGWKRPRRADSVEPGHPLSRAFLPVDGGVAFCRVVNGWGACTTLDTRHVRWTRGVRTERRVDVGRWTSRRAGPTVCPATGGGCRVVG